MLKIASRKGFSTVIAILLTAFLVILCSWVLFLFMSENRINRALFDGLATYAASEGGMEYALLKVKNHKEGFQDVLDLESNESKSFLWDVGSARRATNRRAAQIGYSIFASGPEYSGSIAPGGFEIIPLFVDNGFSIASSKAKDPTRQKISRTEWFSVTAWGEIVWNLLGNDSNGMTFGLVGTGGLESSFGTRNTSAKISAGQIKTATALIDAAQSQMNIDTFLSQYGRSESAYPYLVLFNPSIDTTVEYAMETASNSDAFTFPKLRIVGKGRTKYSLSNMEFREDHSRLFDVLKYSLYNTNTTR